MKNVNNSEVEMKYTISYSSKYISAEINNLWITNNFLLFGWSDGQLEESEDANI